jgi:hypothetical protein
VNGPSLSKNPGTLVWLHAKLMTQQQVVGNDLLLLWRNWKTDDHRLNIMARTFCRSAMA